MSRKNRFVKLTEEQRLELEAAFQVDGRPVFRQRCHYILLSDQGHTINSIVAIYGVCRQVVAKWFSRYESSGIEGLATEEGRGVKPILRLDNEQVVELVKSLVDEHPQHLDKVRVKLEAELGKPLSKRTLHRFLKKLATAGNASAEFVPNNQTNKNTKLSENNFNI